MDDFEYPYCDVSFDIDEPGYEEDKLYEGMCPECCRGASALRNEV